MDIKVRAKNIYKTKLFQNETKYFFNEIFPKLFKKYRLKTAKGGKSFEKLIKKGNIKAKDVPDMSYPMHILNGIVPALKILENKWIEEKLISNKTENSELKMILRCLLFAFSYHDINKLYNEIDLNESIKYLEYELSEFDLNNEEKEIIKYLILSTENRTRYTISDEKLPSRYGIDKIIKEDLTEIIHLADSISIPIEDYSELVKIWKKLKEKNSKLNVFYFDEVPYEVLVRFIVEKLRKDVDCYLITPRGFIFEGNLNIDKNNLVRYLEEFLYSNIYKIIKIDRQKAQLDIFRFVDINEKNLLKLIEKVDNYIFYNDISSKNEEAREIFTKKIEEFSEEEFKKFKLLKILLQLTPTKSNEKNVKKLKKEFENKYFKLDEIFDLNKDFVEKIKKSDTGLKNYLKLYIATKKDYNEKEILDDLVRLLNENYKDSERVNLSDIVEEILSYAYLNGKKIENIKFFDVNESDKVCCICGREAKIVAIENICFGFSPRGFTNRTIVSLSNKQKYICPTCMLEVIFRKIIFGKKDDVQVIYIDVYDYFVPVISENLTNYIEKVSENLGNLDKDIKEFIKVIYGFREVKGKELYPFLMAFTNLSKQIDFIRFYRSILDFVYETGFKIYVTYPFNPDKIKKETLILDYSVKSFKKLGFDKVRLDEIEDVRNEFYILYNLAKKIKGKSKSDSIFVSLFNDYANNPMAIYYYLYKLDNPLSVKIDFNILKKRIRGDNMNILERLADIASDIEWAQKSMSSKTSIIRESLEILKTGIKKGYDEETIKSMIAGFLYKKYPYPSKKEKIEEFCNVLYDELFKGIWKCKIPSKKELRYWIYAFAYYYDIISKEKKTKIGDRNE